MPARSGPAANHRETPEPPHNTLEEIPMNTDRTTGLRDTKVDTRIATQRPVGQRAVRLRLRRHLRVLAGRRHQRRSLRHRSRQRLEHRPGIPDSHHRLHPDPKPHGRRVAPRPRQGEPCRQPRRQRDLYGLDRGNDRRRDLAVLPCGKRCRGRDVDHHRAHRMDLADTSRTNAPLKTTARATR